MCCRFCGAEINNQSKFCGLCGKPQDAVKKSSKNIWPTVLYYVMGVFFILLGVIPYLLSGDLTEYNAHISSLYTQYPSPAAISAISLFIQFSSLLSPLFYFSSSVITIYIGFLLLKKVTPTVPVIVCVIVHIVSIIYSAAVNLLIYCCPQTVISFYTNEASVIAAGKDIINSEPDMLYFYQDNAICRLIISLIFIVFVVLLIFIKRRYMNKATSEYIKMPTIGSIVMILSISLLSVISSILSNLLGRYYENYAVAANTIANHSFNLNISSVVLLMFIIIIGITVIFTRIKRWILAIPTISIVAILGCIAFLFSNALIKDMETSEEIFIMASNNFRWLVVSSAAILIAMFYWFSSIARNKIPTWLQITLPLLLPIVYIGIEIFTNTILYFNSGFSCGFVCIALITVMISLLVRSNKQQII